MGSGPGYPGVVTALPLALAFAAAAQEPSADPVIVVTGTGLDQGRGDDVYSLSTIGRDRLDHSPSNRLEDVLRDIPGFQQFRRSDARSANPTSQGATLRALGGNASSRTLLLLDGVPQSDPFGGWISWPAFDPRRLGEIRVVRGGGTGADGPGALTGTIELISAAPEDMEGVRARLAYGSRDSIDAFGAVGAALGGGFLTVSGAWAQGDGFIPIVESQRGPVDRPSPYVQGSLSVRAVAPLTAAVELQANLSAFTDSRERGLPFSDIETDGADGSVRLVGRGRLPFSALLYVQVRDFANSFASADAARADANQVLDQYSVPSTGLGARFELRPLTGPAELRIGADWREAEGRTQELFLFSGGTPQRGRIAGGRTRTVGSFAEFGWESGAFTVSAGGRLDRWWIEEGRLRERVLATGASLNAVDFPDRSGWEATGRAGIAWRPAEPLSLRAAAYRGWRLPTLNELFRPFRVGADATAANAALAPERLEGIEAGLEYRPIAGARLSVSLFANRLTDAIANVTLGQGPGLFPGVGFVAAGGQYRQRRNLDAVVSRGIEADASLTIGRWRLAAGYSYADAEIRAQGSAAALDDLRPAQAPRHSATASVSWEASTGQFASLTARYVGDQFEDDLNRVRIPDALTFDALALWPVGRGVSLEARAENLADARIVSGISGDGIVERATPRTLWIGIRWEG